MAVSLSNLGWIPLGLAHLLILWCFNIFCTIGAVVTTVPMGDSMSYLGGGSLSGSVVKTEVNWLLSKLSSFWVSLTSLP